MNRCRSHNGILFLRRQPILPLFLSLLLLGTILYLLGWLPKANAGKLAAWVRRSGVVFAASAVALVLSRNLGIAVLAGMLAYPFAQKTGWFFGEGTRHAASGSVSTVRTPYLEISLDRASGAMSGRVLKGQFAGRALSDFTAAERLDCLTEFRGHDAQAAQLFEAYLDRTSPGWNGGAGLGAAASRGMGIEEAYLVLGLTPGATQNDIHAAHRNLMKRFHPDQGGSTYIAAKVNEAKDVLLKHTKV